MGVHGGVSGSACQVLAVPVGDVLAGLGVAESFSETKIDYVHVMLLFADTYQEVVWLNVAMKEVPRVNKLDSLELNQN